jgi:hypothetical protein
MRIQRLLDRPIITVDLHPTIGTNIQGPSMIRAPDWIGIRLGDYYLYFADHKGNYTSVDNFRDGKGETVIWPN